MNAVDLVILIVFLALFLWGLAKGIVRLFGWWFGIALAYYGIFFQAANVQMFIGKFLNISDTILKILSYILIVILAFVVMKIISLLVEKLFKAISLNWINRLLGGILLGGIALLIALSILHFGFSAFPPDLQASVSESYSYQLVQSIEPFLPETSFEFKSMKLPQPQTKIRETVEETVESFRGQVQEMIDKGAQQKKAIVDSLEKKHNQ